MKKIVTKIPKMSPEQALEGLKMVYQAYQENHKITEIEKTKRKEIEALENIEIEKIKAQKEVIKEYFEKSFSERKENFKELFNALDKGIDGNNIELIQATLGPS